MTTLQRSTAERATTSGQECGAREAWRRRVARIGSEIQLAFAALWFARGAMASGWPGRIAIAIALATGAVAVGVYGAIATRGLAPRPRGAAARHLERAITVATVLQLAASCVLPVIVGAVGRSDLATTSIAASIGVLLLWLWARLRTPGHLAAGILLIVVPGGLALTLAGSALTAVAGLATAVILTSSAIVGFGALARRSGSLAQPQGDGDAAEVPSGDKPEVGRQRGAFLLQ
jgi:hypothetical protein